MKAMTETTGFKLKKLLAALIAAALAASFCTLVCSCANGGDDGDKQSLPTQLEQPAYSGDTEDSSGEGNGGNTENNGNTENDGNGESDPKPNVVPPVKNGGNYDYD